MKRHIAILLAIFCMPVAAFAQEADPIAEAFPLGASRVDIAIALAERGITDPAVMVIMESQPSTPDKQLEAASLLANLGQPELAKLMLDRIIEAQLDEAALAALLDTIDSTRLLKLSRAEALQPEAGTLVDSIFTAADKLNRDHEHLVSLLPQLLASTAYEREQALVQLTKGREDSVKVLLHALATAETPEQRAAYTDALVNMGSISVAPLLGALESSDETFRAQVIVALGLLEVKRSALLIVADAIENTDTPAGDAAQSVLRVLFGRVPTRAQAAVALEATVKNYLSGPSPLPVNSEGIVTLWHWDAKNKEIVSKDYPGDEVGLVLAAQLAGELSELAPENPRYRKLFLSTLLEAAKLRVGYDQPIPTGPGTAHDLALAAGKGVVQDVLEYALEHEHMGAAAAAAGILGEMGDSSLLIDGSGYPTPLVRAARVPDRRVRFAALTAIMAMRPRGPFPGASYVTEALGYFAQSPGIPRVVVGSPQATPGQKLVAELGMLGYEGDVAFTGRQVVERASTLPDVKFVIVHETIIKPGIREVLYELARDPNTGHIPVQIISTLDGLADAQRMAADFPRAFASPRPHSAEDVAKDVAKLKKLSGRNLVMADEGLAQAKQALIWIGDLADQKNSPFDKRELANSVLKALFFPELASTAAPVLAKLPSALGQQSMVDLASLRTTPIELRKELAAAIDDSIRRHGVLLTTDQIIEQYNRYNLSVDADRDTQIVLGLILDSLEKPTRQEEKQVREEAK